MFFQFAAWNAAQAPVAQPPLASIEQLVRLHPQLLLTAIEQYYATRNAINGPPVGPTPDYRLPNAPQVVEAADLRAGINAFPQVAAGRRPWDHLIYAYMIENARTFEIFDRVVREFEAGERFETPDVDTALWLRTTEALFYRDLPSGSIGALTSWLRPDLRATRRNTYYRLLGLDLNHGLDNNRPYTFDKPAAANRDFVTTFEAFLTEVWRGSVNAQNAIGPNDRDDAAIADAARRLHEMLNVRRTNGNLTREEFWAVVTMSWFHLALVQNTPIVMALKAEAQSPGDRLRKLGERVGVPAHTRADAYFTMAFQLSSVLSFIETDPLAIDPMAAPGYYMPAGPNPQLAADMRIIITQWSIATGRNIKSVAVSSPATALAPSRALVPSGGRR
jgi:hypothetical protein